MASGEPRRVERAPLGVTPPGVFPNEAAGSVDEDNEDDKAEGEG